MKFSVIIPVYRTSAYLDRCVRSVLDQTNRDLELILVDDCCPDGCGKLCDEYAALDPRVQVIHMPENVGLGFARNAGLAAAVGDFIIFLDSDDWLQPEALNRCEGFTDVDILVFGTTFVYEKTGTEETRIPQSTKGQTPREKADIFLMLTRERIFQFAWNKLYRREFLLEAGVLFEKTPLIEDFLFNMALLPKAQCIACIPYALHFYTKPAHETLASKYHPEFFQLCKRKYLLEREYLSCTDMDAYTDLVCENFIKHLVSATLRNASPAANLSPQAQRTALRKMVNDPVTVSAMADYRPHSLAYRILKHWIVCKNVNLLYISSRTLRLFQK